jgi:hypothetical protein
MAYAATREHAHELIERIDPEKVPEVVEMLEKMLHPLSIALANAPFEDEAISEDENRVAAEARARGYQDSGTPLEEFLGEFGMTVDEFHSLGHEPMEPENMSR